MENFELVLQNYLQENNIPIPDIVDNLEEIGIIADDIILELKEQYYCIDGVILGDDFKFNITLSKEVTDFCVANLIVPISLDDNILQVAVDNPFAIELINHLKIITTYQIIYKVSTKAMLKTAVNIISYTSNKNYKIEDVKSTTTTIAKNITLAEGNKEDGSIKAFVRSVIEKAILMKASDIHIENYNNQVIIRFRIDGKLKNIKEIPNDSVLEISNCIKIFANMDITKRRIPQDGKLSFEMTDCSYDIRVSTLPNINGEKIVMRLRAKEEVKLSIEDIGINSKDKVLIDYLLNIKEGLIIVTGPTGSGKSTTLVSFMSILNLPDVNIVTVEDPVEVSLNGITQVGVNEKQGLDFETALKSALRQDIDILMIGEMRDRTTAEIATRAALTGHGVFTTLHTDNSVSAIYRLLDMGVEMLMIKETLKGVVAQRLVRKLCPSCKQQIENTTTYTPKGCDECLGIGFKGRIGIFEVLIPTIHLKKDEYIKDDLYKYAKENGLVTLRDNAERLVATGITSYCEIERVLGKAHLGATC
ncbi:MAG: hypothetical protein BEN19_02730 [Epulopiscium sp. Nuni2H_MBin003]|nr:MAG: hypothetical protein BEN19_02730 [Epulopiscium sp. Nuni2H_MBin003]